jgi:hypothetical protein
VKASTLRAHSGSRRREPLSVLSQPSLRITLICVRPCAAGTIQLSESPAGLGLLGGRIASYSRQFLVGIANVPVQG